MWSWVSFTIGFLGGIVVIMLAAYIFYRVVQKWADELEKKS